LLGTSRHAATKRQTAEAALITSTWC